MNNITFWAPGFFKITVVLIPWRCRQDKRQDKALHFLSLASFVFITSLLLDNERWKQAEVPAEFQDLVDSVSDGRISLPEKKTAGVYLAVLLLTEFIISKSATECDGHILMSLLICVCSLSSGGIRRKLILFFFNFFCYWC